jgi:hypothetical protein
VQYVDSWKDLREDLRRTLNFIIPSHIVSGTVVLTVTIGSEVRSENFSFNPTRELNIAVAPVYYVPRNSAPSLDTSTFIPWSEKIWPITSGNIKPTLTSLYRLDNPLTLPGVDTMFIVNLNLYWLLMNPRPDYLIAWLPNEALYDYTQCGYDESCGSSFLHAGFCVYNKEATRCFAHEVAHLMGRYHTKPKLFPDFENCENPTPKRYSDWPYEDASIQEVGVELVSIGDLPGLIKVPWRVSGSVISTMTYDYMSYCGSVISGTVWTSPWTYSQIFSETLRLQTAAQTSQTKSAITQPYFIASGLLYTDDTAILDPIWVITPTVAPQNPPTGTHYCLEAQDAGGTVLSGYCFDLAFRNYETGEATNVDGFNLMLPYPSGAARIVLRKGAQQLAIRPVSAHVPTVTVLSPNGGETWAATGTYTITWTASDADGDPLAYSVLYSPNGSDWLPVAAGITQTQVAVNAAELAGGNAARVRVLASDGVNTTADESDAPFTVARKAPQAFILSPERDITIAPGTPLWLQGYAYDLEDGTLPDMALRWSSSRDGNLGTGSQVLVSLSPGEHVITLTATDSDGNVTSATVRVYVGHKVYLPLVLRNR